VAEAGRSSGCHVDPLAATGVPTADKACTPEVSEIGANDGEADRLLVGCARVLVVFGVNSRACPGPLLIVPNPTIWPRALMPEAPSTVTELDPVRRLRSANVPAVPFGELGVQRKA
jgi:hypothetical protein